MQEVCLRLMGKKLLVALAMEGKFASEGLQAIDGDDDMLTAMARELVQNKGIGESADSIWRSVQQLRPSTFPTAGDGALIAATESKGAEVPESPTFSVESLPDSARRNDGDIPGQCVPRIQDVEQLSLF